MRPPHWVSIFFAHGVRKFFGTGAAAGNCCCRRRGTCGACAKDDRITNGLTTVAVAAPVAICRNLRRANFMAVPPICGQRDLLSTLSPLLQSSTNSADVTGVEFVL